MGSLPGMAWNSITTLMAMRPILLKVERSMSLLGADALSGSTTRETAKDPEDLVELGDR